MLENTIKNNFSQFASTTMGQKVKILTKIFFSSKCLNLCFFDQNQLFYAYLKDNQYKKCIFSSKFCEKVFLIKILIFFNILQPIFKIDHTILNWPVFFFCELQFLRSWNIFPKSDFR
jgi:hypothetical protein